MIIKAEKKSPLELKSDLIVLGLFDEKTQKCEVFKSLDNVLDKALSNYVLKAEQFKPKFLSQYELPTLGKIETPKVLIVGLGEKESFSSDKLRQVMMSAIKKIKSYKNVAVATIAVPMVNDVKLDAQVITEGLILGGYSFDKYKSEKKKDILKTVYICTVRERCFDAPQGVSLTPIKAFSVAEAMIALLIGSLILGYSAPMIAGQIKHNNMSDVQAQVLNRKIEELRSTQANIPSGAVMYFDLASCPVGWSPLSTIYPNAANAFIRNQSGSGRALGDWQQNAAPNIEGKMENFVGGSYFAQGGTQNWNKLKMSGAFRNEYVVGAQFHAYSLGGYLDKMNIYFDASENGTTAYGRDDSTEVRPDNIVLLACRKNDL